MKNVLTAALLLILSMGTVQAQSRFDALDNIEHIQDIDQDVYDYLVEEWRQVNIANAVALRADKLSKVNEMLIDRLHDDFKRQEEETNASTASAMAAASLPFSTQEGKSFMLGGAIHNSQAAVATGLSYTSRKGNTLKFTTTKDSKGGVGASLGSSFRF